MVISETEVTAPRSAPADAAELVLDAQTFKDLDVFRPETAGMCLFDFLNLSPTEGGARALRRRMEHPSSSRDRIRATQASISFINAHRRAFTRMPPAYTMERTARYMRETLPTVTQVNLLQFGIGAFSLWATYDTHYYAIVNGVRIACGLIHALRRFVGQEEMSAPAGELASLVAEIRELLARPYLARIPDTERGGRAWKTLRLDQVFRVREKQTLGRLLKLVYEIDALIAMADVTDKYGFIMPDVDEGRLEVRADGVVHPYLANAVANPVELDQQHRLLFLTGPNMAGKTTYLRAFATALYMAHLGMGVPARSFRFVPAQRLFSSISLNEDLRDGVSYFRAEALRVKAIALAVSAGYGVVAILDEPFKGTNVRDAFDASLAVLERFARQDNCLFMFSSHLIELSEQLRDTDHIDFRHFAADEGEGRLHFDFLLHAGVSRQRLGMRVLREEGVFELLD